MAASRVPQLFPDDDGRVADARIFRALRHGIVIGIPAGIAAGVALVAIPLAVQGSLGWTHLLAGVWAGAIGGVFFGGFVAMNTTRPVAPRGARDVREDRARRPAA